VILARTLQRARARASSQKRDKRETHDAPRTHPPSNAKPQPLPPPKNTATRPLSSGAFAFFAGSGDGAVPVPPAGSSSIRVSAKPNGSALEVAAAAGAASVRASFPASALRRQADAPLELAETPRVSVLHSALLDALMRQAHARYAQLSAWPDFSRYLGRDDYYYRAHPEDVKKLHALADGFHAAYEAVADSEGLAHLATGLIPEARRRKMGSLGPAVGPTVGNAAVTRWFLSKAA
jgi:hypothetical protein